MASYVGQFHQGRIEEQIRSGEEVSKESLCAAYTHIAKGSYFEFDITLMAQRWSELRRLDHASVAAAQCSPE